MFEISADDIVAWAAGYGAAASLPRLIRRLIHATASVEDLRFRADAGVRLAGFDGTVTARTPSGVHYVPAGRSVWELSVEQRPLPKIKRDFAKRSAQVTDRAIRTFVAVSGRRCDRAEEWADARKREGGWREVIVLDADDLATWIELAPAVAAWFGTEQLHRALADVTSLEARLRTWTRRTSEPLPASVLTLGTQRMRAATELRAWASSPGEGRRIVRASSRDEAAAFVCASLIGDGDLPVDALVIDGKAGWRWASRAGGRLPVFVLDGDLEAGEAPPNARVIVVENMSARGSADLTLDAVPWSVLETTLVAASFGPARAERLARESRGDLQSLQRLLGASTHPLWFDAASRGALSVLALIDAWTPTMEGDSNAVTGLGIEPAQLVSACVALATCAEPAVSEAQDRGRAYWMLRSRRDVWRAVFPSIDSALLDRFAICARDVLGEIDPRFDLPEEQRFAAALYGKVLRSSPPLREGIAAALVMLRQGPDAVDPAARSRARSMAPRVVRDILVASSWRAWASVADVMPILAESAPEEFLDALEASLRAGSGGVGRLFALEEPSGRAPHSNLLWAIENCLWHPDLVFRALDALAGLADVDPGGKLVNRPYASLVAALHPALPQSRTTHVERVKFVGRTLARSPRLGWRLVLSLLDPTGMLMPGHRPTYADWGPGPVSSNEIDRGAFEAQSIATRDLALVGAANDPERWRELLTRLFGLEDAARDAFLTRFESTTWDEDAKRKLWPAVRQLLHLKRLQVALGTQTDEPMFEDEPSLTARLVALYDRLTPTEPVARHGWLFQEGRIGLADPSGSFERDQERLHELQRAAIDELFAAGVEPDVLARLADEVGRPDMIGAGLAERADAAASREMLVEHAEEHATSSFRYVLAAMLVAHETDAPGATLMTLERIFRERKLETALVVALYARASKSLWLALERDESDVGLRYWRSAPRISTEYDREDHEFAIDRMLRAGATQSAFEHAGHVAADASLSSETVMDVLEAVAGLDDLGKVEALVKSGMLAFYAERLLDYIDGRGEIADDRVITVELMFASVLRHSLRRLKRVNAVLERDSAQFVQIVEQRYRRAPVADAARATREAESAYRILEAWNGVPGRTGDSFSNDALERWAREALRLARERDLYDAAAIEVGRVLARAPGGADGVWPCEAARSLLEDHDASLRRAIVTARLNMRGMTSRALAAGGTQERALAAAFEQDASVLAADWPRTADVLRDLAASYKHHGAREDAASATTRAVHGLDVVDDGS